jgi:hypothetical protein
MEKAPNLAKRACHLSALGADIGTHDVDFGHHAMPHKWGCSSAGEHFVDIEGVTGSIPVTPTISLLKPSHTPSPTITLFKMPNGASLFW